MKTLKYAIASLAMFWAINVSAQGSGKVTLKGEIESTNQEKELQISILDFSTKSLVQRNYGTRNFSCELSMQEKYLIHFKKEGSPALRMVVDTHAPSEFNYFIMLKLNLVSSNASAEQGISQSLGTLSFDINENSFSLKSDNESAAQFCKIQHVAILDTVAKF